MNNKNKLFLLLAVVFCLIPFQSSWGAYPESGMQCATYEGGSFKQLNGLEDNEYCIFDSSSNKYSWNQLSYGLNLKQIKVPYATAENIKNIIPGTYDEIKNVVTGGSNKCNTYDYNPWPTAVAGLYPFYIFDKAKTIISNSCLPGYLVADINAGALAELGQAVLNGKETNTIRCTEYSCCDFWRNAEIRTHWPAPPANTYENWSFPGCGPLENAMGLSVSGTSAITGKTDSDGRPRNEVAKKGSFTLDWNISNPSTDCTISGTNPTLGGDIDKNTRHFAFNNVKTGIYTYALTCSGILNGQSSPDRGARIKQITVYTSDIPDLPTVKNFYTSSGSKIPIGESFKLGWGVTNDANSTVIYKTKSGTKTNIVSNNEKNGSGIVEIDTNLLTTGIYTFSIETSNTTYPLLGKATKNIIIEVGNVTHVDSPEIQFNADKTEVEKNGKVTLTWNVSKATDTSIDHEVGKVLTSGSAVVYPSVTTTYTLTATSPIKNIADVKKTVTIKIKTATSTPVEPLKPFVPPEAPVIPDQPNKPAEKETIDLRVNNIDGPITLNAPATFTLSWNLDTYCLATGSWLGIKLKAGTQSVTLNKNGKYTYSLYCPGHGTDSAVVNIVGSSDTGLLDEILGTTSKAESEPMPIAEASISSDQINYSKNLKVIRGEPVNIYVKADKDINNDGKISRDATGKWTDLLSSGGYCLYNASLQKNPPKFDSAVSDPDSPESCNVFLGNFNFNDEPGTYKYGLFRLLQNDNKFSDISYVNITVENPPLPDTAPVIDLRINGDDNAEQVLGTPADYNVTWDVVNADSCEV